jgi:hypothetical protein
MVKTELVRQVGLLGHDFSGGILFPFAILLNEK